MQQTADKLTNKWYFSRLGGFDQVDLRNSRDLLSLAELDQKLWATLSCPTQGLVIDPDTLALIDTDHDGRIKANEVIAAVTWAAGMLKNSADLLQKHAVLPLFAINDADPDGAKLLASAKQILKNLDKEDATELDIEELNDLNRIFAENRFNGDGIIPASATDDEFLKQVIADIMQCYGEETDRSGEPGINHEKLESFFTEAQIYHDWHQSVQSLSQQMTFAKGIEGAAASFMQIKAKIDDYFTRCQLAEFDERAQEQLNPVLSQYELLAGTELSAQRQELAALPVAAIAAGKDLPLSNGLNPAWYEAIQDLRKDVLAPVLGDIQQLSWSQWRQVSELFADYQNWLQKKPQLGLDGLGTKHIEEILSSQAQTDLISLIEQDQALSEQAAAIESVDRLLHYYRDLSTLLNNFISFRDFYNPEPHAIFQAGVLYLDGRSCQLSIRVDDIEKHSHLAKLSRIYLAYCVCRRIGSNETINIVAAITSGDSDNLMEGRNGVFYDRNGQDWDATIVKIIDHPISIGQAFWAPYRRIGNMISSTLEKSAAGRDKATMDSAIKNVSKAENNVEHAKPQATPFDVAKFAGIFAAIGLAIGAIGAALAGVIESLKTLHWWQLPLVFAGVALLISGPSMLIAYLKLRKRNLAPVLDACGWAVNAKAYINIPFGHLLTGVAKLPKDAERQMLDPFREKKKPWRKYLWITLILSVAGLLWRMGYLHPDEKPAEPVKTELQQPVKTEQQEPASANPKPPAVQKGS
jgi:hypothetical protein